MGFSLMDFLLPRETKFFNMLEQLSELLLTSTRAFNDMVLQIESLNADELQKKLFIIKDCEQRGDRIEAQILDELDSTFITPIDREDISVLTVQLDKGLDILNSISRRIEMYDMRKLTTHTCQFASILLDITTKAVDLIVDLRHKRDVKAKVEAMHKLENDSDYLFHASMAELFAVKEQYQTIEMTMFKELYEHLETAVDSIDYLGKLVRSIRMKQG